MQKKVLPVLTLVSLMCACQGSSIAGKYGFQLGKEKGTHFGLFLNLSNEDYSDNPDLVDYKKMVVSFSVSFPQGEGEEMMEEMSSILDLFKDEEGNFAVSGYYKLTDEYNKLRERRLSLGFGFTYLLQKFVESYEEMTGEEMSEEAKNVLNVLDNNDLIESVIYATYSKGAINAYIPVSMDDVYYQLYWYGYDVQITLPEHEDDNYSIAIQETEKHELGSAPTQDEVKEINDTFYGEHVGMMFTSYRAFNDLKLTLNKK